MNEMMIRNLEETSKDVKNVIPSGVAEILKNESEIKEILFRLNEIHKICALQ